MFIGFLDIRNPWTGPMQRPRHQYQGPRSHYRESFRPPPPPRSPAPRIPFGRLPPPSHWTQRVPPPAWVPRMPARTPGQYQVSVPMPPPNFGQPPPPFGVSSQAQVYPTMTSALPNVAYTWAPPSSVALTQQSNGQLTVSQATGCNLTQQAASGAVVQQAPMSFLPPYNYQTQPAVTNSQFVTKSSTPPLVANLLPGTQSSQPSTSTQVSYQQQSVSNQVPVMQQANMATSVAPHLLNLPPPPPPNQTTSTPQSPTTGQLALVDPRQIQALQYAAGVFQQYSTQPYYRYNWQQ